MPFALLAATAIAAYGIASLLLAVAREPRGARRGAALALGGLAALAHLGYHAAVAARLDAPDLHFFAALSQASAIIAALTVAVALARPVATLGLVAFPLALALLGLDLALGEPTPSTASWQITLHAGLALLAFATLSIGALVAVMLVIEERALRAHRFAAISGALPPLALVERLLFQLIGAGFVLLSAAILAGVLFVEDLFAQHLVHKTVLSLAAWVVFGGLLLGRWRRGWRGRRAVRWTFAGMALLALAFVGTKFVLELVLHRGG